MKHKSVPVTLAPDSGAEFEAVVSVFNNKDLGGDIVRPGAFSKSLKVWEQSGDPIPVYWSHRMDDPTYNIGQVVEAKELAGDQMPEWANEHVREHGGLYVKATLDDYGVGAHVAHLLKTRRVKQFSFSYDVMNESKSAAGDNELLDVFVHEIGPTPLGMNPLTELLSTKAMTTAEARKLLGIPEPPDEDTTDTAEARRFFYARQKVAIDVQALLDTH